MRRQRTWSRRHWSQTATISDMDRDDENDRPSVLVGMPALTCLEWSIILAIVAIAVAVLWPEFRPARE